MCRSISWVLLLLVLQGVGAYGAVALQAELLANDPTTDDRFGVSVAIDGDSALVGASGDDNNRGSAYLFDFDGAGWHAQQKITPSDGADQDIFVYAVALDGDTALIGAPGVDGNAGAYVFVYDGVIWKEQQSSLRRMARPAISLAIRWG